MSMAGDNRIMSHIKCLNVSQIKGSRTLAT